MGMLSALEALPFALFSIPTGVWLDRSRKLPTLLASKVVALLSLACIAAAGLLLTVAIFKASPLPRIRE
jgi:hypothetical protein